MREPLIGVDLGEGDRPDRKASVSRAHQIDEAGVDVGEGLGKGRPAPLWNLALNGLGESDQGFGEAFKKFARSAMKTRIWSAIHGKRR